MMDDKPVHVNKKGMYMNVKVKIVSGILLLSFCLQMNADGCHHHKKRKKQIVNGQGSTLAQPLYDAIIPAFAKKFPRALQVTYNTNPNQTGSSKGLTQLLQHKVVFAGSDVPPTNAQEKSATGTLLTFPTAVAGVSIAYNLPGNPNVTFSAQVLANIFRGKITNWKQVSPALPNLLITPVARSDGSGSTNDFTTFLSRASSNWPTSLTGNGPFIFGNPQQVSVSGSTGVANAVKSKVGSIGYVGFDIASQNGLKSGLVINASKKAIAPSIGSITAAANISNIPSDLRLDTINSPNSSAYPIASPTNIVVFKKQPSQAIARTLREFLDFILSSQGTKIVIKSFLGPLPSSIVKLYKKQDEKIHAKFVNPCKRPDRGCGCSH